MHTARLGYAVGAARLRTGVYTQLITATKINRG